MYVYIYIYIYTSMYIHTVYIIYIYIYLEQPQARIWAWICLGLFFCLTLEFSPDFKFSPERVFYNFAQDHGCSLMLDHFGPHFISYFCSVKCSENISSPILAWSRVFPPDSRVFPPELVDIKKHKIARIVLNSRLNLQWKWLELVMKVTRICSIDNLAWINAQAKK